MITARGSHTPADGLGMAYFALLAPATLGCLAVAILRTRALPRWIGSVPLSAAVIRQEAVGFGGRHTWIIEPGLVAKPVQYNRLSLGAPPR